MRPIPFSIMWAIGVLVWRQSCTAAPIRPSQICSRIRFMKFISTAEALRIAQKRSKKMKTATPPRISRGHIRNPPARKSSPSPIVFGACSAATATASVACNRIIISSIKSFLVFRSFPSRARQRPHTHTAAAESQKYAFSSKSHRGPAICGHFYFPSAATFRLSAAALRSACRSSRDRRRRCRRSLMFRIRSPKLSKLCR